MGRRGPKGKAGNREANGRLSRKPADKKVRDEASIASDEWEAMSTALMARWRVHKVPASQVRDQMAGSYIGRLCLAGELTQIQYDAAQSYLADRQAYHMAIDAPKQMPAVDLNAVHGRTHAENVKRSRQAIEKFMGSDGKSGVTGAIREAQQIIGNRGNLWAAIDLCVVKEIELHHMLGDTRLVLNALARHYGLESRRAA